MPLKRDITHNYKAILDLCKLPELFNVAIWAAKLNLSEIL